MTRKKHSALLIGMILTSIFLVEVSHHYGSFIGEIFVENTLEVPNIPIPAPDLIEETAKEDYLHFEDFVALISDYRPLKNHVNLMTESLFEQNVLVPPPDSSIV